jgi:hypothetical protein
VKSFLDRLNNIGFEGTRRAVAALALSIFVFLYLLVAMNPPSEEWRLAFLAMSACYGVAFMGVAAEWFWGRWFASGLGFSGVMVAVGSFVMIGWSPILAIYGALHAIVVLALAGKKMADRFDLQPAWRERYGMDEYGIARLRKTVTRASASLPSVILYFLAPKEPGQGLIVTVATVLAATAAIAGLRGTVRLRGWGIVSLAAAAALFTGLELGAAPHFAFATGMPIELGNTVLGHLALLSRGLVPALLTLSIVPFIGPTIRFLRARA